MMKNKAGVIIYVGKSVNLHSRVSSYWSDEKRLNFAKQSMIQQVQDIEVIETRNELEALVLETNLIKEKQPKYNILMKDGKNLAYIHITEWKIPEIIKTHHKKATGIYFWPYTAGANVTEILKILKRIFSIRSCHVEFIEQDNKITIWNKAGKSIPCLDYSIGLCPAPCLLEAENIKIYEENISSLKQFLSGKSLAVIENLRGKMQEKAKKLEFEEAQKIKLQIEQIEKLGTKQIARDSIPGDYDAIICIEKYNKFFIGMTSIRSGHIIGVSQIEVENKLEESIDDVLSTFLGNTYFGETVEKSVKILLQKEISDLILIAGFLSQKREIEYPQIGPKTDILKFVEYNLLSFAEREHIRSLSVKAPTKWTQENILKRLGYNTSPEGKVSQKVFQKRWNFCENQETEWVVQNSTMNKETKFWTQNSRFSKTSKEIVFECYDISHTHGQFTVASRSVIVNGKSEISRYRKYKIKTLSPGMIDDFASLREVLYRRTLEGIEQNNFPNMIIIDGGKWQLSSVIEAMNRASEGKENIPSLPYLCSIAKREEEIFTPWKKDPTLFEKGSMELMLLQKIRDESHRFAIGFNRSTRSKSMRKNILEELPWFGPVARKNILKIAGSIDNLHEIPREEIEKVLTKKQLQTLEEHGLL